MTLLEQFNPFLQVQTTIAEDCLGHANAIRTSIQLAMLRSPLISTLLSIAIILWRGERYSSIVFTMAQPVEKQPINSFQNRNKITPLENHVNPSILTAQAKERYNGVALAIPSHGGSKGIARPDRGNFFKRGSHHSIKQRNARSDGRYAVAAEPVCTKVLQHS